MKVTLLTGASNGIGKAWAERLAADKHNLFLVARSEAKLKELCGQLSRQHGITAQYMAIDLSEPGADLRVFEETEKRGLVVDCLINNAGIGTAGDFIQIPMVDQLAMLQLNITTLVSLTYRYLQQMRARNSGNVVNVASMAAFLPSPFMATYAASKAFVKSFTEAIAEENRPFNIRVMLLCPGATETSFFDTAKINAVDKKALLGKTNIETPEMVADAAMKGLKSGNLVVISGRMNRIFAKLSSFVPNAMITKFIADSARSTLQKV